MVPKNDTILQIVSYNLLIELQLYLSQAFLQLVFYEIQF